MTDRRRTPTRPYSKKRGGPPSVTTILGVIDKPGLMWASSREAALYAVHHTDEWQAMTTDAAVDRIRRQFRGVWDSSADVGTAVHKVNELWTYDEDVDLVALVKQMRADSKRQMWPGLTTDEVVNLLTPYIDGLEMFWNECNPRTIQTEEVVRDPRKPHDYIGQRDWVAMIDSSSLLVDAKTTKEQDPEKGMYADSWRLQLAAYRLAPEIVTYDDDGNETGTLSNIDVDRCAVLHMRGDGAYQLIEMQAGEEEHQRFLAARQLYEWVNKESKKPAPVIVRPELIAAEAGAA